MQKAMGKCKMGMGKVAFGHEKGVFGHGNGAFGAWKGQTLHKEMFILQWKLRIWASEACI